MTQETGQFHSGSCLSFSSAGPCRAEGYAASLVSQPWNHFAPSDCSLCSQLERSTTIPKSRWISASRRANTNPHVRGEERRRRRTTDGAGAKSSCGASVGAWSLEAGSTARARPNKSTPVWL
uniref:Uncharacterized protein n=1 Tax=Arundo donax TaxID=35708 RepID=A0A0A9F1C1_ARUDO